MDRDLIWHKFSNYQDRNLKWSKKSYCLEALLGKVLNVFVEKQLVTLSIQPLATTARWPSQN